MLAPPQPQQPHVAAGAGSTGPAQQRPATQVAPRDTQSTASQGQIHRQVCNGKACRKHAEDDCMVRWTIIARFTLTLQLLLPTGGAGSRCKRLHGTQLVESVQQVKPKHASTHIPRCTQDLQHVQRSIQIELHHTEFRSMCANRWAARISRISTIFHCYFPGMITNP